MYPRLVTTPYFTLHTFGVLLALAYLIAIWWVVRAAGRERLKVDRITSLCFWAVLGGLVGAKLLLLIREWPLYAQEPEQLISRSFLESAGDFYGGFLGALAASMLYFLTHPELPFWKMADLFGPAIALGQAIGRIGCLMAGDDYGTPTKLPWGVRFTHPDAALIGGAPLGIPLHPVQLYESLFCLALFFFLVKRSKQKKYDGELILTYTLLYAVGRFFLEYLRGDIDRGFLFNGLFTTSQFIALILGLFSLVIMIIRSRASQQLPAA